MPLTIQSKAASPFVFLFGFFLGSTANFSPAAAAPYDQLEQACKPKFAGTHDCLDPVPGYSYHLPVTAGYSGELCLWLGDWEGENQLAVEWDGLQTRLELTGKSGIDQLLQSEKREGRSSAIVLYSDRPLMPEMMEQSCSQGRKMESVTAVAWPEMNEDQGNLAQISGQQIDQPLKAPL